MEEDIKILRTFLEDRMAVYNEDLDKHLENILNRLEQLEKDFEIIQQEHDRLDKRNNDLLEENKRLEQNNQEMQKEAFVNSIPKSVIREKIEELEAKTISSKDDNKIGDYLVDTIKTLALKELLGGSNE